MLKIYLYNLQVNYFVTSSACFSIWFPSPPILIVLYILRMHAQSPQSCLTLCDPTDRRSPGVLCPWDFLGKNTGVGCHFLLQGIFLSQGSNLGLLHCRYSLLMSHWESPYIKDVNPLFLKYFANVFSHFVICVLIMLKVGSFAGLFVCLPCQQCSYKSN